jgi:hypothetical protein
VTSPEKNSGKIYFTGIGTGEDSVSFSSLAGFEGAVGGEGLPGFDYVASRGGSGWGRASVVPSGAEFLDLHAANLFAGRRGASLDQSGDLGTTLWLLHPYASDPNAAGFYVTRTDGSIEEVGPALPPDASSVFHDGKAAAAPVEVQGFSGDGSRVVFKLIEVEHEAGAAGSWVFPGYPGVGGLGSLLEYAGVGNSVPVPVGVEDDGLPAGGCASQALGGVLRSQAEVVAGGGGTASTWTHNAISKDGKTVFFSGLCGGQYEIFARIDNGEPGAHTVAVSEPTAEGCAACDTALGVRSPGYFVGASRDGLKVFFTTKQPLLEGASGENLYEYDISAPVGERVVRISRSEGVASPSVEGVLQVSEDGSRVYFVATGVLTENPNSQGQKAAAGLDNLYVYDSESQSMAFIATLSGNDAELWQGDTDSPIPKDSDVTPNGRFLVFASHTLLTPDDTSTAAQIFEYDALTGALVRVSIGEGGYKEDGNMQLAPNLLGEPNTDAGFVNPNDAALSEFPANYEAPYAAAAYGRELVVAEDESGGSYVFFVSSDALVKGALNFVQVHPVGVQGEDLEKQFGAVYAENVYEYHDGQVYLISDGRDVSAGEKLSNVQLLGTDPSGRDVFFTTTDQLVGEDTDSQLDIYDARIGGGFPEPPAPVECSGDTCQGALSAPPVLLSPGSEFQAGENPPLVPVPTTVKPKKKTINNSRKKKSKGKKSKKSKTKGKGKKSSVGKGRKSGVGA